LHKKEATLFAQDVTLLFSLFALRSFELLCIGGTRTIFVFVFSTFFYSISFFLYVTLFSSFVYLSHRACFGDLLNSTHTHKPSHGRDTCKMLHNAQKATLNRIGTQIKKRGYKG
jgi:hypothetical protein